MRAIIIQGSRKKTKYFCEKRSGNFVRLGVCLMANALKPKFAAAQWAILFVETKSGCLLFAS